MRNKTELKRVAMEWEAQAISELLKQAGIASEIENRPREYSALVTGQIDLNFRIYIDSSDLGNATQVLKKLSETTKGDNSPAQVNHFGRVLVNSVLGVLILPVVFNLIATKHFKILWAEENSKTKKSLALLVLAAGWIFCFSGAVALYYGIKNMPFPPTLD